MNINAKVILCNIFPTHDHSLFCYQSGSPPIAAAVIFLVKSIYFSNYYCCHTKT